MDLAEYARHDALGLADLVRRREVAPAELAGLAMAAAERVNGRLGAVIELFDDRIDALREQGASEAPFAGVPLLLKDLHHGESGRLCENGSGLSAGYLVSSDSGPYRRLRAAGLVSVGRSTTSEWGIMGTTETALHGPTCSPWGADRIAGGSSGGAGAAVGAGIVPLSTASDGGGSIRIPAACCGVVGLKTTRGRVSFGPEAGTPLCGWAVRFAVSRSVRDSAALLDATHGPDPGEPFLIPPPARPYLDEVGADPGSLRIAYCTEPWSGRPGHADVRAATEATARLLEALGHAVEPDVPEFEWEPFLDCMTDMWSASTAAGIDAFADAMGRIPGAANLEPVTLTFLEYGRAVTSAQLLAALDYTNVVNRRMGAFFERYDVLLTPTLGGLVPELGEYATMSGLEPRAIFDFWSHNESTLPAFNCTGQPAISLPLHHASDGSPIGMQLVGRFGDEATLFRVAAQLETALPWRDRIPPIHVSM